MPPKGKKVAKKATGAATKARGTKRARSPEAQVAPSPAGADAAAAADKPTAKRAKVSAATNAPDVGNAEAATAAPTTSTVTPAVASAPAVVAPPAKAKPSAAAAAPKAAEIDYSGKFDLYSMSLPFLNSVYAPNASTNRVYPEELYNKILIYQAKNDRTAKINLPTGASVGAEGTFESYGFCDPMEDMPFDIEMTGIEKVPVEKTAALVKGSIYSRPGKGEGEWVGEGLKVAKMEIEGGGGCGIASSGGSLAMAPMWAKGEGENRMELWEGKLTFKVKYSGMYSRKGHGSGQNETYHFWAIRGQK